MYIQCIYNVYTMYIQCIYNAYTMYIQCIYNVYTMYINIQCLWYYRGLILQNCPRSVSHKRKQVYLASIGGDVIGPWSMANAYLITHINNVDLLEQNLHVNLWNFVVEGLQYFRAYFRQVRYRVQTPLPWIVNLNLL